MDMTKVIKFNGREITCANFRQILALQQCILYIISVLFVRKIPDILMRMNVLFLLFERYEKLLKSNKAKR